jgi:hypothetical protein
LHLYTNLLKKINKFRLKLITFKNIFLKILRNIYFNQYSLNIKSIYHLNKPLIHYTKKIRTLNIKIKFKDNIKDFYKWFLL